MTTAARSKPDFGEIARYIANGLVATAVHYAVLSFSLEVLMVPSAGLASLGASVFGITASFFGSRYFVFRLHNETIARQAAGFVLLYAAIACLHGLVLAVWTDLCRLDYRWGFLVATCLQMALSYWGNKRLVFKPAQGAQRS
jgi:putative flippase GtrA